MSGGVSATSSTAPALTRRPLRPAADAAAHFPTMWGRKRALMLSPDVFRGLPAFQEEALPGPGTGAGGNGAR